jgi:hypothetical protein
MSAVIEVPVLYKQIGWQKCIACSDSRTRPGMMWLGLTKIGTDIFTPCPECNGTTQVPQYIVVDARTGKEIDYEAQVYNKETDTFIHHTPVSR